MRIGKTGLRGPVFPLHQAAALLLTLMGVRRMDGERRPGTTWIRLDFVGGPARAGQVPAYDRGPAGPSPCQPAPGPSPCTTRSFFSRRT